MLLSIGSIALAFIVGAGLACAWPTPRQRAAYWTGYATGRLRKLAVAPAPVWVGIDHANEPDRTVVIDPRHRGKTVLASGWIPEAAPKRVVVSMPRRAGKTTLTNEWLDRRDGGAQ